jgi:acyl carrier protein
MTTSVVSTEAVGDAIMHYLQERFPQLGAVDLETPLLGSAAIDSLGFLDVVSFLEERFGIALEDDDFDADNLQTTSSLVALVERKLP